MPRLNRPAVLFATVMVLAPSMAHSQEIIRRSFARVTADANFKPVVASPTHAGAGPTVVIDEAHANQHTADGTYRGFADLLRADGYTVVKSTARFTTALPQGARVLVIANARGGVDDGAADPAFTPAEVDAIVQWVEQGGSLLLAAGNPANASSARALAERLGVQFSGGSLRDSLQYDSGANRMGFIIHSTENGALGTHPVLTGVQRLQTFDGQAVRREGATALFTAGASAFQIRPRTPAEVDSIRAAAEANAGGGELRVNITPAVGAPPFRSQGIAFELGRGRVVVLADPVMLTAAVIETDDLPATRIGLTTAGRDNQRFALNVIRWLSGAGE